MNQSELLIEYGWLIALLVAVGVISWAVLILQALFHDKRIALVGVFGSLMAAYPAVFPELGAVAAVLKIAAVLLNMIFLVWFLISHYKRPVVFLPVVGLLLSLLIGYRLYQAYLLAG